MNTKVLHGASKVEENAKAKSAFVKRTIPIVAAGILTTAFSNGASAATDAADVGATDFQIKQQILTRIASELAALSEPAGADCTYGGAYGKGNFLKSPRPVGL